MSLSNGISLTPTALAGYTSATDTHIDGQCAAMVTSIATGFIRYCSCIMLNKAPVSPYEGAISGLEFPVCSDAADSQITLALVTFAVSLSERRRYCGARRLCVCVSTEPQLHERCISLGGDGNALYPMLYSLIFL